MPYVTLRTEPGMEMTWAGRRETAPLVRAGVCAVSRRAQDRTRTAASAWHSVQTSRAVSPAGPRYSVL